MQKIQKKRENNNKECKSRNIKRLGEFLNFLALISFALSVMSAGFIFQRNILRCTHARYRNVAADRVSNSQNSILPKYVWINLDYRELSLHWNCWRISGNNTPRPPTGHDLVSGHESSNHQRPSLSLLPSSNPDSLWFLLTSDNKHSTVVKL